MIIMDAVYLLFDVLACTVLFRMALHIHNNVVYITVLLNMMFWDLI